MKNNSCKWLAEYVAVSMNLSRGHREVTVRFHGLCAKQTKSGKWNGGEEGSEGARVMRVREKKIDRSRRSKGYRGKKREREREGGRGSLGSSIGRFKDDHALSATHHTTLRTNQPSPTDGNATRFTNRLETTPKFQGHVLWRRTSSFAVQFARKRTDPRPYVREERARRVRSHAYMPRKNCEHNFFRRKFDRKRSLDANSREFNFK